MRSQDYWLGVATALAFQQADLDTRANWEHDESMSPVLRARLPYIEKPEPEDPQRFGAAIDYLNSDEKILYWRHVSTDEWGEHTIELGSTEGYRGLPEDWENDR